MAAPIEDYALLSDLQTGPLISRNGSVDWLCFPWFDSPSLFSSLLGLESHGRWLLSPHQSGAVVVKRQYVDSTFVLETVWKTPTGSAQVTDFMPLGHTGSSILRRVTGLDGRVEMRQELIIRSALRHRGAVVQPNPGRRGSWSNGVVGHGRPGCRCAAGTVSA
ncbi:trehalase-like domain-containing protein [Arthrobacter sp. alpha11c]